MLRLAEVAQNLALIRMRLAQQIKQRINRPLDALTEPVAVPHKPGHISTQLLQTVSDKGGGQNIKYRPAHIGTQLS